MEVSPANTRPHTHFPAKTAAGKILKE